MYEVTQDYLDKATAVGRVYSLRVDVGRLSNGSYTDVASYTGGVGVLALKIVRGQTTGGFSLGGTVCASLNGTFANNIDIKVKDRLQVYVRFGSGTDVTAWRGLGWFYVDSVKHGMYSQSVTAYDAMLRLEKNYKSKLTYPAKTSDVLAEISSQTGINLSTGLTLINDATIEDAPLKDESQNKGQRYYTRREMLGYIGATNAGSGYIDVDFKINLSIPTEVSQGITASSVISQSVDDTDFSIANIVWNKSGVSYSLNDEFTENTIELVNPLGYVSEELILHNLETKLVGLTYSSVKLKKQGTGIYQLGDLVDYTALDETVYKMLVMGIVYDFSNGFFSETLYSLAKSASQQEYSGSQITNQKDYINESISNLYVSLPVSALPAAVNYDTVERGLLSVDFTVGGIDSAVVFAGAQQCNATSAGTVDVTYEIDGAKQDYKPSQILTVGKHVLPHYLATTLSKGKHNLVVYIASTDGRGSVPVNGLAAALSGQISDVKINTPPNDNLLLRFNNVPAGTTVTIPRMYQGSGAIKTVDWGDGSAAETSDVSASVEHTYVVEGDYLVTIESTETRFVDAASGTTWGDYLTAVYFPDNTATIGLTQILRNCPNLETVYLGKSATSITLYLTGNGGKLASLVFPDTVTVINVSGLESTSVSAIVIPERVTSAGAFNNNSNLKSIEFYSSVVAACTNASGLTRAHMTDKVTSIPNRAFLNCSALVDVTFSQNITTIGEFAFSSTALTALPPLPKLTTIGNYAFQNCSALASAEFGDKVTTIGNQAFYNCTSMADGHLPAGIQTVGISAFQNVPIQFTKTDFPAKLTSIGRWAFSNSGTVSTILRDGVTYGGNCFQQCSNLSEVTILDGVSIIPAAIFYGCPALTEVVIPSSVIKIENQAFYNSGLTTVTLNEGLTTIGVTAFAYSQLSSVTIPGTVTAINGSAFNNCKALESVSIKKGGLKTLSQNAFAQCSALKTVTLGDVTQLDNGAFLGCTSLTEVLFNPDTVLGSNAFYMTGLKSVNILNFVKLLEGGTTTYGGKYNIGGYAFRNCTALAEVDGYEYKFDVGLKMTEQSRASTSDSWGEPIVTDLGLRSDARGIYNKMGATEDSVFLGTALKSASNYLKEHPEYSNENTSTYIRTYTAYDIKSSS